MVATLVGSAFILVGILSAALDRLYGDMPVKELRRQARFGDPLARNLYRVAAYGWQSRVLFWAAAIVSLAAGMALVLPLMTFWSGFALLAAVLAAVVAGTRALPLTYMTASAAALFSPAAGRLLGYVHGPLGRLAAFVSWDGPEPVSAGPLFEKQDLLDVLHRQHGHAHNRIAQHDLELAARALSFGDRQAADVLRPRKELFLVSADDPIGPVLLDQMHASGQKACLVYKDKKSNIVGSLHLSDAAKAKDGGRVFDLIRGDLVFVHEDFSLKEVLAAFHETGQHIAAVVNRFEEFLGVVTLEALTRELLGDLQPQAADYGDRAAIAAYEPADSEAGQPAGEPVPEEEAASLEPTEVVQ